jgi:hypothetical protein
MTVMTLLSKEKYERRIASISISPPISPPEC